MTGSASPGSPSGMDPDARLAWAQADQKMRVRRYFKRIAVRILAVPLLFVVPHAWVPWVTILAVMAGLSAVIGGNDPDAARDFIHDDGSRITPSQPGEPDART